jgi:hypothetical protein
MLLANWVVLIRHCGHGGQRMLIERMLGIVPHLTRQMQERWRR